MPYSDYSTVSTVGLRDIRRYDGAEHPLSISAADHNAMVTQTLEDMGNRIGQRHGREKTEEEERAIRKAKEVARRRVREGFEVEDPHRELVAERIREEEESNRRERKGEGESKGGEEEEDIYKAEGEYKVGEYECQEYQTQEYKSIYE